MIRLRNVKVHQDMSEETLCFSADIVLRRSGRLVGSVKNRGHGGPHEYFWHDRKAAEKIKDWADRQETPGNGRALTTYDKLDCLIDERLTVDSEVSDWL